MSALDVHAIGQVGTPDADREADLRARLAAAADYGRQKIADTRSACSRDLCWYLIQLADADVPADRLPREVRTAEHLWRAAMEVERLEQRWCGGPVQ